MTGDGAASDGVSRETSALGLSDAQVSTLVRYHDLLATDGIVRGLIGPREGQILWERHLLNCAVVAVPDSGLLPRSASVADIGSGAGLPGLVWAIVRPDLQIHLVEPLLRRAVFLEEVVSKLGLADRVLVVRSRAEELSGDLRVDVTTARAVAPLTRLLPMLAPLTRPGGWTVALKGSKATEELAAVRPKLKRIGYRSGSVLEIGEGIVNPPTRVVRLRRQST